MASGHTWVDTSLHASVDASEQMSEQTESSDKYRYGIFLRPPSELGAIALQAMLIAKYQFMMPAAIAYPPHITLVGSIALRNQEGVCPVDRSPSQREAEMLDAVSTALENQRAINADVTEFSISKAHYVAFRFKDHSMKDSAAHCVDFGSESFSEDEANLRQAHSGFRSVMGSVLEAVRPLRCFHDEDRTSAQRKKDSPDNYRPHLTVLSHDGAHQPEVTQEAYEYMMPLVKAAPTRVCLDTLTAYRLYSDDWSGEYWHTMQWSILKSWTLPHGEC